MTTALGLSCPDCTGAMSRRHEHGIEIDACARCGGIWFDRGELEAHRDQLRRAANQGRESLRFHPLGAPAAGAMPALS